MSSLKNRLKKRRADFRKDNPMIHRITVRIELASHDDSHPYKGPNDLGPVIALKTTEFFAMGRSLDDAIQSVHKNATEYLTSSGVRVGSGGTSTLVGIPTLIPAPGSENNQ
jgi:hypothetical protein